MPFLRTTVRKHGWPKIILLALDCLAITLAAATAFLLRYVVGFDEYDLENSLDQYLARIGVLYLSLPLLLSLFRQNLLYKYKVYSSGATQFAFIVRCVLLNSIILIAALFFIREDLINHSRSNIILFSLSCIAWCSVFRIVIFRRWIVDLIAGRSLRRILLIGSGEAAEKLLSFTKETKHAPYQIVAAVSPPASYADRGLSDVLMLDHVPLIKDFASKHDLDEVIIAEDSLPYEEAIRVISECRDAGVMVNLLSDHFRVIHERVTKNSSEFLNVATAPLSSGVEGFYALYLKRVIDFVGSVLLLLLLSPLFAGIAILIKLGSRGPVFYRTTVIGLNGQPFTWFKFRTMRLTDPSLHKEHVTEHIRLGTRPTGKLQNDPRITPIGRWLRRHSIDELPQLWSVLRGDMSLIGPRPCLPYEYEQYQEWHKERFVVRPGMTGLWQVSGRSSVSFNDMVILDLYYIHNLTLWLDAAIAIRTVGVVLTGKGGG